MPEILTDAVVCIVHYTCNRVLHRIDAIQHYDDGRFPDGMYVCLDTSRQIFPNQTGLQHLWDTITIIKDLDGYGEYEIDPY